MKKIVNLTPHAIVLRINASNMAAEPDATDIVIPPQAGADGRATPARVTSKAGPPVGDVNGIPIYGSPVWGPIEGLLAPAEDTIYIVSFVVLGRPEVAGRGDLVQPGTGPADGAIRYGDGPQKGQVFAVTRLVRG